MNPHLPDETVSKWLSGERTLEEEEHVRECEVCRAEVERLTGALMRFRDAVHQSGASTQQLSFVRPPRHRLRWAVAALALTAAAWPVYRELTARRAAKADAILLEQVDAQVSRAIARPMEPLARLMSWEARRKSEENR